MRLLPLNFTEIAKLNTSKIYICFQVAKSISVLKTISS